MSDHDFNFAPPPQRRERKEFEPPPWEQSASEAEPRPAVEVPTVAVERHAEDDPSPGDDGAKAEKPQLDEVQVAAMMFELRAEEVPAARMYARATLVAGALLLLIGIVMVIWSFVMIAVALRRPEQGRAGVYVGMMVLVFGTGFAGTGAWFVFKTLRQQGVL